MKLNKNMFLNNYFSLLNTFNLPGTKLKKCALVSEDGFLKCGFRMMQIRKTGKMPIVVHLIWIKLGIFCLFNANLF